MKQRGFTLILLALLIGVQWPLWFGKGGWLRVWELEGEVAAQTSANDALRLRNQKLQSEVLSLRDGLEAIEERARYELGMVGVDETYVQIVSAEATQLKAPEPAPGVKKP
jgi:cell division protein FtsB